MEAMQDLSNSKNLTKSIERFMLNPYLLSQSLPNYDWTGNHEKIILLSESAAYNIRSNDLE